MNIRLFFIGDSFINGTGDPEALGWVGRVCAALQTAGTELTFYNLGIRGDTTTLIARRWQAEVQCRLAPDSQAAFVFSFGANDINFLDGQQRVEGAKSLENAQAILATAQAMGPVLMLGSPPVADDPAANQRLASLCDAIESLCQRQNIPYISTWEAMSATPVWKEEAIANDGAHPRAAGYQALATLVQRSPVWQKWTSML